MWTVEGKSGFQGRLYLTRDERHAWLIQSGLNDWITQDMDERHPWLTQDMDERHPWLSQDMDERHPWLSQDMDERHPWLSQDMDERHPWLSQDMDERHPWLIRDMDERYPWLIRDMDERHPWLTRDMDERHPWLTRDMDERHPWLIQDNKGHLWLTQDDERHPRYSIYSCKISLCDLYLSIYPERDWPHWGDRYSIDDVCTPNLCRPSRPSQVSTHQFGSGVLTKTITLFYTHQWSFIQNRSIPLSIKFVFYNHTHLYSHIHNI